MRWRLVTQLSSKASSEILHGLGPMDAEKGFPEACFGPFTLMSEDCLDYPRK